VGPLVLCCWGRLQCMLTILIFFSDRIIHLASSMAETLSATNTLPFVRQMWSDFQAVLCRFWIFSRFCVVWPSLGSFMGFDESKVLPDWVWWWGRPDLLRCPYPAEVIPRGCCWNVIQKPEPASHFMTSTRTHVESAARRSWDDKTNCWKQLILLPCLKTWVFLDEA
jgi:hypothetical protein